MCKKVGKSEEELLTLLWGDHYLDGKKIIQHADLKGKTLKPLFVQFVLENIWKVYESCLILFDQDSVERMCLKLGVKVNPREINSKDKSGLLRSVMGGWIPLSRCVLLSVVRMLPSPLESQPKRMTILLDQMNTESNTENVCLS